MRLTHANDCKSMCAAQRPHVLCKINETPLLWQLPNYGLVYRIIISLLILCNATCGATLATAPYRCFTLE